LLHATVDVVGTDTGPLVANVANVRPRSSLRRHDQRTQRIQLARRWWRRVGVVVDAVVVVSVKCRRGTNSDVLTAWYPTANSYNAVRRLTKCHAHTVDAALTAQEAHPSASADQEC
jgi:hypothetical protein